MRWQWIGDFGEDGDGNQGSHWAVMLKKKRLPTSTLLTWQSPGLKSLFNKDD